MRIGLILILVLAVVLVVTNPGMEDFRVFVRENSEDIVLREAGDSALGRILSGAASALAGNFVDDITDRDEYYAFSIYTIDLDGPDETGNEWRFLGIAGQFELDRPEALQRDGEAAE